MCKRPSEKQKFARKRNFEKMRLMGMLASVKKLQRRSDDLLSDLELAPLAKVERGLEECLEFWDSATKLRSAKIQNK